MTDHAYLEALLSVPRLGSSAVSPDGRWIAWTWSAAGANANVHAAALDGDIGPIQLSAEDERTVVRSWTQDNGAVVVAQDHGGDEHVQLLRIDLATPCVLQALTPAAPSYYVRGGQIHPNGRWLIYAANVDADSGRDIEASWVYRHDLVSGERQPLARPNRASDSVPELNDAGTHILYTRSDLDPAGVQVWLVDIEGRNDREILNWGDAAKVTASWLPDGRRVLYLAETGAYRQLGVYDIETGLHRPLIDDPERNLETAFAPRGLSGECVVVVEVKGARSRASLLDLTSGNERALYSDSGNLIPLAATSGGTWIGEFSSARHPADLVRFQTSSLPPTGTESVTRMEERSSLDRTALVAAEEIHWKSSDGLDIQGWLYRPRGAARGTIVQVHGGPTAHSEDGFDARIQYFVSQGFTVLCPNYRGSTGFGLAFEEAVKEDGWGGREQEDIRTGIEALLDRGLAEPGKIGITGTSYGGYSAWWAITHWPTEIVAAAAPICGMTDLVVDYRTTRPDLRPYSEEMMGGSPDDVPLRYQERSPINFVHQIQGRLLIVQGLRDPNVTPENVEVVRTVLDRAGIEYEVLTFDDEGHGIKQTRNLRTLCVTLTEFFAHAFAAAVSA